VEEVIAISLPLTPVRVKEKANGPKQPTAGKILG
jgi:hypothetical protein